MRTKTTTTRKRRNGSNLISFIASSLRISVGALVIVCLAVGAQKSGTPASRSIEGSVVDIAGQPVKGAVVLLEDTKSLQVRSYLVQEDGKFRFRGLSMDANYELRARSNSVFSNRKTVSVFDTNPLVVVNLTLSPGKSKRPAPAAPSTKL